MSSRAACVGVVAASVVVGACGQSSGPAAPSQASVQVTVSPSPVGTTGVAPFSAQWSVTITESAEIRFELARDLQLKLVIFVDENGQVQVTPELMERLEFNPAINNAVQVTAPL